jgi:hypothetical protein
MTLKKGYQPRTNIIKDEKRDFVADSYSILARWRNISYKLFNVHGVYDDRHIEIHTAVFELSAFEVELVIQR